MMKRETKKRKEDEKLTKINKQIKTQAEKNQDTHIPLRRRITQP